MLQPLLLVHSLVLPLVLLLALLLPPLPLALKNSVTCPALRLCDAYIYYLLYYCCCCHCH